MILQIIDNTLTITQINDLGSAYSLFKVEDFLDSEMPLSFYAHCNLCNYVGNECPFSMTAIVGILQHLQQIHDINLENLKDI